MSEQDAHNAIYEHFRDEVKREDGITQSRTMSALTLHGFLFASSTFLLSNPWWDTEPGSIQLRIAMILGIGIAGLLVSLATYVGVVASIISLSHTRTDYDLLTSGTAPFLKVDQRVPQIMGRPGVSALGGFYAEALQTILSFMWAGYLGIAMKSFFYAPGWLVGLVPMLTVALVIVVRWRMAQKNRYQPPSGYKAIAAEVAGAGKGNATSTVGPQ